MKAAFLLLAACGSDAATHDTMVNNAGLDGSIPDVAIDGANASLSSSDLVLPFGTVLVDSRSTGLVATISNSGGPSTITNVVISGASDYLIDSGTCLGATLATSASCTETVRFAPLTAGVMTGSLTVTGSAAGSASVTLKGTGAIAGALAFTPADAAFNNVAGNAIGYVDVMLQNVGTTPTGAIAFALSGPDVGLFQIIADNCAGGLAASNTCTLTAAFSPTSPGARSATLSASDALGGTMTAALTGTGI